MQKCVNCSLILCVHRSVLLRPWGEWCVSVCVTETPAVSVCLSVICFRRLFVASAVKWTGRQRVEEREKERKRRERKLPSAWLSSGCVSAAALESSLSLWVHTHTYTQEITVLFTPDLSVYEVWTLKVKVLDTEIEPGLLIFCTSYQPVCECLFIKQLTVVAFSNTTISLMLYRRGGGG